MQANSDRLLFREKSKHAGRNNHPQVAGGDSVETDESSGDKFLRDDPSTSTSEGLFPRLKQSFANVSSGQEENSNDIVSHLRDEIHRKDLIIEKLCSTKDLGACSSSNPFYSPFPHQDYQPQLENIISDQNLVIEKLERNHRVEKERSSQLEMELNSLKYNEINALEKEVEDLNVKLLERERSLKEEFVLTESENIKQRLQEEFKCKFSSVALEIEKKYKEEIERLESIHNSTRKQILKECRSKEYTLQKELEILKCKLIQIFKQCPVTEDGLIDNLRIDVETIRKSINASSVSSMCREHLDHLASVLASNIALKAELESTKAANSGYIEEIQTLKRSMSDVVSECDLKLINLQHSLNNCNSEREKAIAAMKQINEHNTLLQENFRQLYARNERDKKDMHLLIVGSCGPLIKGTNSLKKELKEMAGLFNEKISNTKQIDSELNAIEFSSKFPSMAVSELVEVNQVIQELKECHSLGENIKSILNLYDCNYNYVVKEFQRSKSQLSNFKDLSKQRENHYENQLKQMNKNLEDMMKEKKELDLRIEKIQTSTSPKEDFVKLQNEKNSLMLKVAELNTKIEQYENKGKLNSEVSKGFPVDSISSLCLKECITHWIGEYHKLNKENNHLCDELFQANVNLSQYEMTKRILEDEIAILKTSIDIFKEKMNNYSELKEKCCQLENEKDVLDFKIKHIISNSTADDSISVELEKCCQFTESENNTCNADVFQELAMRNIKILSYEEKLTSLEQEMMKLKLKLVNSDELARSLQDKVDALSSLLKSEQSSSQLLVEENLDLKAKVKTFQTEINSLKWRLDFLNEHKESCKVTQLTWFNSVEKMRDNALECLKAAIDRLSEAEKIKTDLQWENKSVDHLDARHREEILIKSSIQLQNEIDDLHLKLAELQQLLHSLQNSQGLDEGWLLQLDRCERELLSEMESHRKQHASIDDALRSTQNLIEDLRLSRILASEKINEIAELEKKLEDEKHFVGGIKNKLSLLESETKEKDILLQHSIEHIKSLEDKILNLEEATAASEKELQRKILNHQLDAKNSQMLLLSTQVGREMIELKHLTTDQLESLSRKSVHQPDPFENIGFQQSVLQLSQLYKKDLAFQKESSQQDLVCKLSKQTETISDLAKKICYLETENSFLKLNTSLQWFGEIDCPDQKQLMDKMNRELKAMESSFEGPALDWFNSAKSKFKTYYDQQLLLSLSKMKEDHQKQSTIALNALKELHNEELTLIKLSSEAEKHLELDHLKQEHYKEQKLFLNSFIQSVHADSSIFEKFQEMLLRDFIIKLQDFMTPWDKLFGDRVKNFSQFYNRLIHDYNEETGFTEECLKRSAGIIHKLDSLFKNEEEILEKEKNFFSDLKNFYNFLLEGVKSFFNKISHQLDDCLTMIKSQICVEEVNKMKEEINRLNIEKEELEDKHKAAINLLVSDHKDEISKIRHAINEIAWNNEPDNDSVALSALRIELERKHAEEVEELRTYFERKCAEMEKHYSEEIFSQHSRKMSLSSSAGSDLNTDNYETGVVDLGGQEQDLVDDDEIRREEEDFLSDLYQVKSCFVDDAALNTVYEKYCCRLENAVSQQRIKFNSAVLSLKQKFHNRIDFLESELKELKEKANIDKAVKSIVQEVQRESQSDVEWLNMLAENDAIREAVDQTKGNLEMRHSFEMSRLIHMFDNRLIHEMSGFGHLISIATESSAWSAKIQADEDYRNQLDSLESQWENRFVSQVGQVLSDHAVNKVKFEEDLKGMIVKLSNFLGQTQTGILQKIGDQFEKLNNLEILLKDLQEIHQDEVVRVKDKFYSDKEVLFKNCDNIVHQIEIEAKRSCDMMKDMYESELINLSSQHKDEMEKLEKSLRNEIRLLQENKNLSEDLSDKVKDQAINEIVEGLVAFISSDEKEKSRVPLPREFETLETIFSAKYKKVINDLNSKHCEEIEKMKCTLNSEIYSLKEQLKAKEEICFHSAVNTGNEELDKIIRERDCLRSLNETLKSAVKQLASYLASCEDELNKTVIEELIRTGTPQKGLSSSFDSPRRVHFAPDISSIVDSCGTDVSMEISGISVNIRSELDNCLAKLKKEAAAILGLSSVRCGSQEFISSAHYLQDKARELLSERDNNEPNELISVIENLTFEGDSIIDELRQEKDDLIQQIKSADSQLKSTRRFLEDQAAERENERDEFSREVQNLQTRIKDSKYLDNHLVQWSRVPQKSAISSSQHKHQIEDLQQRVLEVTNELKVSEEQKQLIENELKSTLDKVWVLTDIITKLEAEIVSKSEREEWLEKRLDELESELEQQSAAQLNMQQQMDNIQSNDKNEDYIQQVMALQEEIKRQYSSTGVRVIKSQLKDMERNIDARIKELESLNLSGSTTSLSSPSEEISIREHMEAFRSETPECPSPVALPLDQVNKLQEKILKQIRAEEMIIKKVKDQDIQLQKYSSLISEIHAERDVLQQKVEQSKGQLVEASNKIDDLRRKADSVRQTASKDLLERIASLENNTKSLQIELESAKAKLIEREDEIMQAKALIESQNEKLCSQPNPNLVSSLRLELASVVSENTKLQEMVEKYSNDKQAELATLYDALLEEKNHDIEELKKTVSFLKNHIDQPFSKGANSTHKEGKSLKVIPFSPLEELSSIHSDVIRDAPSPSFCVPARGNISADRIEKTEEIHPIQAANLFSISRDEIILEDLNGEDKISHLESEVKELKILVEELNTAKKEVETCIVSLTDDKKHYEGELNRLMEIKQAQEGEIFKLKNIISEKDAHIVCTTEDIGRLQSTLKKLQEKVKEASMIASKDHLVKSELIELEGKCKTLEDTLNQFNRLKEELITIGHDLSTSIEINEEDIDVQELYQVLGVIRDKLGELCVKQQMIDDLTLQVENMKLENAKLSKDRRDVELKLSKQEDIQQLFVKIDALETENSELHNCKSLLEAMKKENSTLQENIRKLETSQNIISQNYNKIELENLKLVDEISQLRNKEQQHLVEEAKSTSSEENKVSASCSSQKVEGLDELTMQIEQQLDLSAKLDYSLLTTISVSPESQMKQPLTTPIKSNAGRIKEKLIEETEQWKRLDKKQNQLTSQLEHLSRIVSSQDHRITQLVVQLDEKKNQCLVLELDLLKERAELKQIQCILNNERARAKCLQKEDTELIETLRLKLETCMQSENHLKELLVKERNNYAELEARLNSAKAYESYAMKVGLLQDQKNVSIEAAMKVEIEILNQKIHELESVISRERLNQSRLKDRLRSLEQANTNLNKENKLVKTELSTEMQRREKAEERNRIAEKRSKTYENQETNIRMNVLKAEICQWKEECLELREHLKLVRQSQDSWTANVQTPLMKQLTEVNRSLEKLVGEKINLQSHIKDLEKERDFLLQRVHNLKEVYSGGATSERVGLNLVQPLRVNTKSLTLAEKLENVMEEYQKVETKRKALIWQKKYLQVTLDSYHKSHLENILRLTPCPISIRKPKITFRIAAHVVCATIKFSSIHRRRSARRKMVTLKMLKQKAVPSRSEPLLYAELPDTAPTCSYSPPSRDHYTPFRLSPDVYDTAEIPLEPSKLRHYVTIFDDLQKRLGRILQDS